MGRCDTGSVFDIQPPGNAGIYDKGPFPWLGRQLSWTTSASRYLYLCHTRKNLLWYCLPYRYCDLGAVMPADVVRFPDIFLSRCFVLILRHGIEFIDCHLPYRRSLSRAGATSV